MGKEFKKRDNYVIKMGKELVPVTREVYEEYHRMERRERYLVERDQDNSLIFFSTLRAEDSSTDVPIRDSGVDVEEEVIKQMFLLVGCHPLFPPSVSADKYKSCWTFPPGLECGRAQQLGLWPYRRKSGKQRLDYPH